MMEKKFFVSNNIVRWVSVPKKAGRTGARLMITSATILTSTVSQCCWDRRSMRGRSEVTLPVRAVKAGAVPE